MLKSCNCCAVQWEDSADFLFDPEIRYIGMQLLLDRPKYICVYFFDHLACGTTLMLNIHKLKNMVTEPIPKPVMAGKKSCPRHCLDVTVFLECENECHNAPYRRLAIRVLNTIQQAGDSKTH